MASVRLNVSGMTCNHCKGKVEQALNGISGVYGVFVELSDGTAEVDYDDSKVTTESLAMAVTEAGYEARVAS
ncbi:MAG: heavy-metal-associated domain-containing protein [Gemmatimonadota bacterium]|nr:MAG: heavy-metal-associated domain-containing protein [Gemmatimonadota bacterium]